MILRRIPMLAISVVSLAVVGAAARDTPSPTPAVFATPAQPWMPAVPPAGGLTSTWFCPGVPASGETGSGGQIVIANSAAEPMQASVTLLAGPGAAVEQSVTVPPFDQVSIDAAASVTTPYASAVVEIDGGGGLVEQRATQSAGTSVAACVNAPSSTWYLAEGFTAENSTEQLVLTNPFEESVIVDIGFATSEGSREPAQLQGFPVQPQSVTVIDLDSIAARDEPEVAIKVVASRGGLIVGRAQLYDGGGRLGYTMSLAAPALRSQWWFANGAKGPGVTERFSIYNPTDDDVEVQPVFLGVSQDVLVDPIAVPARQVVTYSPDAVAGLPDDRHALVFGTDFADSIVVERAITRTIDDVPTTSVLLGGLSRPEDGFVANTWTLAIGPGEPTADALVVYNIEAADATVTVQAVTPEGLVPVPSLADLALPANGLITIPLTEPEVLDNQLVIRSTSQVFVERSLPREPTAQGRSASWAVPVVG